MEKGGELDLEVERSRLNDTLNLQLHRKTGLTQDYINSISYLIGIINAFDDGTIRFLKEEFEALKEIAYYQERRLFISKHSNVLTDDDKYVLFEEPNIKKLIQEINNIVNELRAIGERISSEQTLDFEKFRSLYKDSILEKMNKIISIIRGNNSNDGTAKRVSEIL